MLRRSAARFVVPFHNFVVGGRPAERGLLYRDSHQNAYSRVQLISTLQRTEEEQRIYQFLRFPDQYLYFYTVIFVGLVGLMMWMPKHPLEYNAHRNKHVMGGFNHHEVWQRNQQMAEIFAYHQEMIEATRKEIGKRPAIFDPPKAGSAGAIPWHDTRK